MTERRVMFVIGTRPEAVKLAPLIPRAKLKGWTTTLLVTAQHRRLLDQMLKVFDLPAEIDLDLMNKVEDLNDFAAAALGRLNQVLKESRPHIVVVQGDTTSAFIAALAATYRHIPTAHVEAGLRTWDMDNPFPEELNRRLIGLTARLHFAPTQGAADNLIREGVAPEDVFVTGNTVLDALNGILRYIDKSGEIVPINGLDPARKLIIVTAHRRENWGDGLESIFRAVATIAAEFRDSVQIVFPVHPNPRVTGPAEKILRGPQNVHLVEPLDYLRFVALLSRSYFIMTDSGGIQEEAPALRKPVLIMRNVTERPEVVEAGVGCLVGVDTDTIVAKASELLTDKDAYGRMTVPTNLFGDGRAGEKIIDIIDRKLESSQ